ncbi:MAG: tetratricopeptide repeat protein [Pirellulaceae bacterium]|nr:tetratricopeptide repeat protein [Pirellulaceae bacterium]
MIPLRQQVLLMSFALLPFTSPTGAFELWRVEPASALEKQLWDDMADGQLQQSSLLTAALIAGGVDTSAALDSYMDRFASIKRQWAAASRSDAAAPVSRASVLLDWLHRHVLTGQYQPACTELHRTLDTGDFSCVTSTILYRCLAESQGLTTETLSQPGHVFCRFPADPPVMIQTTSPTGIVAPASVAPPLRTDGVSTVSQAPSRMLTDVQLVAKIYYNRGVLLLKKEAYPESLPWLLRASQLDPDDAAAHSNLLACLNNWAISECHADRFERAMHLLDQGKSIAPDCTMFTDNEIYVHYRWAQQLCEQHRYAEALDLFDAASSRRPAVSLFDHGRARIAEIWLNSNPETKLEDSR